MIRNTFSMLIASALAAGCTVTSTPAGPDGGPGSNDAGGLPDAEVSGDGSSAVSDGAPDAGVSSDAATAAGCAFGEPNDTRETATPIDVNHAYTGLCVSNADGVTDPRDFYVMTAPNDSAGGYVTFTISNVGVDGDVEVVATAVADGAVMIDVNASSSGASVTGWFTVSPGAKYRVEVKRFAGLSATFTYDLNLAYTKINDMYEPNNTRADAKAIALASPIQASAAAFSANAVLAASDGDDWYKVTLAAGSATVKLGNAPADFLCHVELFDSSNGSVGAAIESAAGSDCQIDATNLAGGAYTIDVSAFITMIRAGSGAPPPSVTGSYTLAVTQ